MADENSIVAAAQTLSKTLEDEIDKLKDVDGLNDFEKRTRSLMALSKAVHTFNDFVQHLKNQPRNEDGTIGSVVEFREKLARRIRALVASA